MVNEAAEKFFKGNAKELKKLEVTEGSLKNNSKIVLTEKGISPTLLIGELPTRGAKSQVAECEENTQAGPSGV
ncbi:MAG: hypothetical protein ACYSWP_15660 [Planctomycetota bacterium]